MVSKTIEVDGIVPAVIFSPNENTTWKKQHTTEVIVEPTEEIITEMKYAWMKDDNVNDSVDALFTGDCLNNRTVTGGDDTMTGTYYLWVMLKTEKATSKYVSGAFYFDHEGPTVELTSTPVSETSFTVIASASDTHSEVAKYEFYIDGEKKEPITVENGTATYIWEGTEMVQKTCSVIVTDLAGNSTKKIVECRTKLYVWDMFLIAEKTKFTKLEEKSAVFSGLSVMMNSASITAAPSFSEDRGYYYDNYKFMSLSTFSSAGATTSDWWFVDDSVAYHAREKSKKAINGTYYVNCSKYGITKTTEYSAGDPTGEVARSENPNFAPVDGWMGNAWFKRRNELG